VAGAFVAAASVGADVGSSAAGSAALGGAFVDLVAAGVGGGAFVDLVAAGVGGGAFVDLVAAGVGGGATGSVAFGVSGAVGAADGSSSFRERERSRGAAFGGAGGAGASTTGGGAGTSTASTASSASSTSGGFGALTSRGGPNRGRIAGSGVFLPFALCFPLPEDAVFFENSGPDGRRTSRSRATRSANCRATISSMVLEALFTSMPCSRLRRSMTS
jgi:hypothetical protein